MKPLTWKTRLITCECVGDRSTVAAAKQLRPVVQDRRTTGCGGVGGRTQILDGFGLGNLALILVPFAGHVVLLHLLQDNIFVAAKFRRLEVPLAWKFPWLLRVASAEFRRARATLQGKRLVAEHGL